MRLRVGVGQMMTGARKRTSGQMPSRTPLAQSMTERRFPPPSSTEETAARFIVRDANGLAYVYYEEEPGRGGAAKGALGLRDR